MELQRLSIQFRKQQKAYLNRLRSKDGGGGGGASSSSGFNLMDEGRGGQQQQQEDYDPGFSDMQARQLASMDKAVGCGAEGASSGAAVPRAGWPRVRA